MSDKKYESAFFVVPSKILNLPDMTLQLLKFYETIFQFWNHGKNCFLSNKMIKERTGMKSDSTVSEAFQYFEKHNLMKRVQKGNSRYIDQALSVARGVSRQSENPPLSTARHNNKNSNNKNLKRREKDFFIQDKDQKHDKQMQRKGQIQISAIRKKLLPKIR